MSTQTPFGFHWFSPLGISVVLFLLHGAIYILVGGLAPFLLNTDTEIDQQLLIIANRTDSIVFGRATIGSARRDDFDHICRL
jgi:hypothetical protein